MSSNRLCLKIKTSRWRRRPLAGSVALELGDVVDAGQTKLATWADMHDMRIISSTQRFAYTAPAPAQEAPTVELRA